MKLEWRYEPKRRIVVGVIGRHYAVVRTSEINVVELAANCRTIAEMLEYRNKQ